MKDTGFIAKKDADRLTALYWRTPEKLILEDPLEMKATC